MEARTDIPANVPGRSVTRSRPVTAARIIAAASQTRILGSVGATGMSSVTRRGPSRNSRRGGGGGGGGVADRWQSPKSSCTSLDPSLIAA
jgi:hypothetical protein